MRAKLAQLRALFVAFRTDAALFLLGWLALLGLVHPHRFAEFVRLQSFDTNDALLLAFICAFLIFLVLAARFAKLLIALGKRFSWEPGERAVQGTIMAEFVLVLPVVLLLLGTVFQLALIGNAALVLRYAAFVAARSAIVNYEAETSSSLGGAILGTIGSIASGSVPSLPPLLQIHPLPEFVDSGRPEDAAAMVLASISPSIGGSPAAGAVYQQVLRDNSLHWTTTDVAGRFAYAQQALTLETMRDRYGGLEGYFESFPPLIPEPEHALQPARQFPTGDTSNAYRLPEPPPLGSLIPDQVTFGFTLPVPGIAGVILSFLPIQIPGLTAPINITVPLTGVKSVAAPALSAIDTGINIVRNGSADTLQAFANNELPFPKNVDPFSHKEVEITLSFDFALAVPSLIHLAPGVTVDAPTTRFAKALRLRHDKMFSVKLQSTGGRRTLLGMFPKAVNFVEFEVVDNTPLYFRIRDVDQNQQQNQQQNNNAPGNPNSSGSSSGGGNTGGGGGNNAGGGTNPGP